MWQEIQGSLRCGIARTMRVVVAVSLIAGVVGALLATKVYIFQEILAGLLSIAFLFAVGCSFLPFPYFCANSGNTASTGSMLVSRV